jgi:hypothetical protein
MFCSPGTTECSHLRPLFTYLDHVFEGDIAITIAAVDCEEHTEHFTSTVTTIGAAAE